MYKTIQFSFNLIVQRHKYGLDRLNSMSVQYHDCMPVLISESQIKVAALAHGFVTVTEICQVNGALIDATSINVTCFLIAFFFIADLL